MVWMMHSTRPLDVSLKIPILCKYFEFRTVVTDDSVWNAEFCKHVLKMHDK